jgi:Uncharacterized conserved protein
MSLRGIESLLSGPFRAVRPACLTARCLPFARAPYNQRQLSTSPYPLANGSDSKPKYAQQQSPILLDDEKGFSFVRHNTRPPKPRKVGVTEIRGSYYSVMGKRYLKDVLET